MSETQEALVVIAGGHRCALPMERVAEVRLFAEATPVPGMPASVRGVVERNGAPVHVVDTALRLGTGASSEDRRACIIFFDNLTVCGTAAMLVDAVDRIIERSAIDDAEPALSRQFVAGMIRGTGETLPLIDIDRFFDLRRAETLS